MKLTKLSLVLLPILFNWANSISLPFFNPDANACHEWKDYDLRYFKPTACSENPDVAITATAEDIITRNGHSSETFTIQSKDFNLQLIQIKIPSGVEPIQKSVVFAHGMSMDSKNWIFQREGSLPFILANLGYDVWLLDLRGDLSSVSTYNTTDIKYWQRVTIYLMHYDLEAAIKKVSEVSAQEIIIIGYSMGAAVSVTLAAIKPEVLQNNQVIRLILFAPAVYFDKCTSIFALGGTPAWDTVSALSKQGHQYAFNVPSDSTRATYQTLFLQQTPSVALLWNFFGRIMGYSCSYNPETITASVQNGRSAMGVYTMDSFAQSMRTGKFYALDYGDTALNIEHYGNSTPPAINLANIEVEVFIHPSDGDILATAEGAQKLADEIGPNAHYLPIHNNLYSHMDYIAFVNNPTGFYKHLVDYSLKGIVQEMPIEECNFTSPFVKQNLTDEIMFTLLGQLR